MTTHPTLYRSYLTLDLTSDVRQALTDVHDMHRLVFDAYAHHVQPDDAAARAQINLLYAVDTTRPGAVRLVTQATVEPRWNNAAITALDTRTDSQLHSTEDTVAFQIAATPTKQITGRRGRHVPLPAEERDAWIARKLTEAGLSNIAVTAGSIARRQSPHLTRRTKDRARTSNGFAINLVTFTGTATVADPTKLRDSQTSGIGRSRAHGAGLLLLRS